MSSSGSGPRRAPRDEYSRSAPRPASNDPTRRPATHTRSAPRGEADGTNQKRLPALHESGRERSSQRQHVQDSSAPQMSQGSRLPIKEQLIRTTERIVARENTLQGLFWSENWFRYRVIPSHYPHHSIVPNTVKLYNTHTPSKYPRAEMWPVSSQRAPDRSNDRWRLMPIDLTRLFIRSPIRRLTGNNCLADVFDVLHAKIERYFDFEPESGRAALFIHDPKWTLTEFQKIFKTVVRFEAAIQDMVAGQLLAQGPHSEEVKDARPNWADSAKLQNLSQIEVFQKIDTTRNIKELSDLFEGPSSPPFLQLKYHKYLNMQGLQINWWPNFKSSEDVREKIDWTIAFLTASLTCPDDKVLSAVDGSASGLSQFVRHPLYYTHQGRLLRCARLTRGHQAKH